MESEAAPEGMSFSNFESLPRESASDLSSDPGGQREVVLGTVNQSEPGELNALFAGEARDFRGASYTLVGSVEEGAIIASSLIEDLGQGRFGEYPLSSDELVAVIDSELLERIVQIAQGPSGRVSIGEDLSGPEFSSDPRLEVTPANEAVGNRYAGPIVDLGEDNTLVQDVGGDLVAHRSDLFENVGVNLEKPLEIVYEFDGPSVRSIEPNRELGVER